MKTMPDPVQLKAPGLTLGDTRLAWGSRTYVMGILNLTPDSFSGDGLLEAPDYVRAAVAQADGFVQAGADLLDVGGESTRPGAQTVDSEQEIARVVPVISALVARHSQPVSIDTSKAGVAQAALDAGASWVNDVWGLRADPELAPLLAERRVPVILMHNRVTPNSAELAERLGGRYVGVEYDDLLEDIKTELMRSVDLAIDAGIDPSRIVLDPGIGFGKTVDQSLELLDRLEEIRALGFPVLMGPSRKSFIGFTLDLPPDDRVEGTAAAVAVGIIRGADIIRVHDVAPMVRVARMTDALVRRPKP